MKMTMKKGDSKFGAPQGTYLAKFLGIAKKDHPEYGPGLEWQFEVADGLYRGKIISRTTAPEPTSKNSCGTMLRQVTGGTAGLDQEIDLDGFIGQFYQVMVGPNSTGNGTRVESLMPHQGPAPAAAPTPPLRANGGGLAAVPPPPPPKAQPSAPVMLRKFWFDLEGKGEPQLMTAQDFDAWLIANKVSPKAIPAMNEDQSGGWKTAHDFGFTGEIPF